LIEDSEIYSSFNTIDQIQQINSSSKIWKKDKFEDKHRLYRNGEKSKIKQGKIIFEGNLIDRQILQEKIIDQQVFENYPKGVKGP
jgi:hypothetical protein